ncbi:hypothetical protein LA56_736 [Francisella philomiragia]|uniref:hypothetical protein n=1 Tax=Francisella philomiragia TaxID=28110 RepID=UPI0005A5640D|nr:hypothetical protein [Francisella philomiragia]AJI54572.1 hypothetical protein LA56_736 [Francisella philomiragia]MBK2252075.1 hypothetical protein [Francisella philomiragia]
MTFEVKAVGDKVGTFAQSTITVNSTTKSVDLTYKADVTPVNPACKDIPPSAPDWSQTENYGGTLSFVVYNGDVWTNSKNGTSATWPAAGSAPQENWAWTNCGPAVIGTLTVTTTGAELPVNTYKLTIGNQTHNIKVGSEQNVIVGKGTYQLSAQSILTKKLTIYMFLLFLQTVLRLQKLQVKQLL